MNNKNAIFLGVIFAVMCGLLFFVFSGNKKVSVYEYVRKADKYYEEGKHRKGLVLLNKAHEQASTNPEVLKQLVYGYIGYAKHLDENDQLDEALEQLELINKVAPLDENVINNLSIFYAKKAFLLAQSADYALSMNYLKNSMTVAWQSKKARKNLSTYLLNKSVEAFNEQDWRTLSMLLNASYNLWPRYDAIVMLGKYFYAIGNLDEAIFYWKKANAIRPTDQNLKESLIRAEKEQNLERSMKDIETKYFDVKFHQNYEIDPARLDAILGDVYERVGADLGVYPSLDTAIIFYTEKDFRDTFNQSGIVRAFYDGKIRMLVYGEVDSEEFVSIIAHEYTHALVSILTDNKCPIWLHEGLAVLEESEYYPRTRGLVGNFLAGGGELSLFLLNNGFDKKNDDMKLGLAYEAANTAVRFILDKWGWNGMQRILKRIKGGTHYVNAIDEEFYVTEKMFETMWNEYVKKEYV